MVKTPLPPNATAAQREKRIQVPCLPLARILSDLAVTRLSYFSLDVEGAELFVLRTLDWSAVRVDVLEWECSNKQSCAEIRSLLSSRGMRPLGKNAVDHVWVSGDFARRLGTWKGKASFEAAVNSSCPRSGSLPPCAGLVKHG